MAEIVDTSTWWDNGREMYKLVSKTYYRELLYELDRIKTSLTLEGAVTSATTLQNKIYNYFEPRPAVIEAKLTSGDSKLVNQKII